MSGPLTIDAIVLSTLRYGETSKIVRLATREHGVQSAIAKGALRPRSRFGAALQPLTVGQGILVPARHGDLHLLTAFDVVYVPAGLAATLERYAPALALAEVMLRFSPEAPHPEAFDVLLEALHDLAETPPDRAGPRGLRWLWRLVSELGFGPALDACVLDGAPVPATGSLPFSPAEGGALCPACARTNAATTLPAEARADLATLLDDTGPPPVLDAPHFAAHRRLFGRYVRHQLDADAPLQALEFWQQRPWEVA